MILNKTVLSSLILLTLSGCHDGGSDNENNIQVLKPETPNSKPSDPNIGIKPEKPVFNVLGIINGITGQPIHGQVIATDKQGGAITYTLSNNPNWLTINVQTGKLSGVPSRNDNGRYTVKVTASNGTVSNDIKITVVIKDSNRIPTIMPVVAQTIIVNTPFSIRVIAHDQDGDQLTYRLINGPSWAKIDANSGLLTGNPTELGKHPLNIQVTDGKAKAFASAIIDVVVNPTPIILMPSSMTAQTRHLFSNKIVAKDPNGKQLRYSMSGQPNWLHLNSNTGVISGTPGINDEGHFSILISVSNGKETVTKQLSLTINDANHAPIINTIPDQTVIVDQNAFIRIVARDSDNDTLIYSLNNSPPWLKINPKTGELSGTPTAANIGSSLIQVIVSDGKARTEKSFNLNVLIDPTPVFSGMTTFNALTRQDFTAKITATDPNNKPLTYSLLNAPEWLKINPKTGSLSGKPGVDGAGDFSINVTVTNGKELQSEKISIHVKDGNKGAKIDAVTKQTIVKGDAFSVQIVAVDPEGDNLTYGLVNAPTWFSISSGGLLQVNAGDEVLGNYTIQVVVNDGRLDSILNIQVDVVVDPTPIINSTEFTAQTRQIFQAQIKATDPNNKPLTYSLSGQPTWLIINPKTGEISGQPSVNDAGTVSFTVTATNGTQKVDQLIQLTVVDANNAPIFEPITSQSVIAGDMLNILVKATDRDNDPVTYSLKNKPAWLNINSLSGSIYGTPTESDIGDVTVTVIASDGYKESTLQVVVHVVVEPTPIITMPEELTGETRKAFNVQIIASDPNNKALIYSVSGNPSWMHIDSATGVLSGTPGRDDDGESIISVTVSNGEQQATFVLKVDIEDANKAPVLTPIADQTMTAGKAIDLQVKATDADQDPLTYTVVNAPAWLSINSKTGVITAAPEIDVTGDFIITVTATDSKLSSSTMLSLHIKPGQFDITTVVIGGGKITPTQVTVVAGDSATFTISLDGKNKVKNITGCNGVLTDNKYVVSDVQANCQINADFEDVGYIPPEAFNTNDFPSDLSGNLEASLLFAQNHVIPAKSHIDGDVHQHLIGERKTLVMLKPKDPKFDEAIPLTMTGYNIDGNKLGTLTLDRPYKLPPISGVIDPKIRAQVKFDPAITFDSLPQVNTNQLRSNGDYLAEQIAKSTQGVSIKLSDGYWTGTITLKADKALNGKIVIISSNAGYNTTINAKNAVTISNGQTLYFINVNGVWYTKSDVEGSINKVAYGHGYWTTTMPAEWLHYGLRLTFNHDSNEGQFSETNVGAPTVIYMNTIDIGMLTQRHDSFEFAKDPELPREFYQTLPTSRLVVSRYQGMNFDEIMMPNGELYIDHAPDDGGWQAGSMRSDIAKSLISIGIDSANYGFNSSAGPEQNGHDSYLARMMTAHTSIGKYNNGNIDHGGSGGGGIVTLTGTVGNEMSHEVGHALGLSHSEGGVLSIQHPADQVDSTWGWDSKKNLFVPNFEKGQSNQRVCFGSGANEQCIEPWHKHRFGQDAMYGGWGSMYPDNRYTMYTPYSSAKIQRNLEANMVFSESSPTGALKWNSTTHKMEPFSYKITIADMLTIDGNTLEAESDDAAFIAKKFTSINAIYIVSKNNNWTRDIILPAAENVPVGSVVRINHDALWASYFHINGETITNPHNLTYRSNGTVWVEDNSFSTEISKKAIKFGVPVSTLLGYYDPEQKLQSYIYPTFHGSRGYTYADDKEYITPRSCHLDVDLANGETLKYWLPAKRLNSSVMNKFHINIAESDNPINATVSCDGTTLATKAVSKPKAGLIQTVDGEKLTNTIS
ncbi:hypothetical protein AYY19_03405 [Photobacterium aquimaris]|uniref:putative Ig domain-containing protein n=1 Tax=Photobacterium aquimaris TaxID=512643 RepID=UPI0007EF8D4B|nr:putative Ig domain-containing protein [Photobacterium aquimaris]OBU16225.1 hypothetical protein AYY19_03405 [Photobacterium aquimaris]PSW02374.1 hypothetical protein CTM91_04670 [Photobacterium aquimaris]